MKKFVGIKTVKKEQVKYPSDSNPRIEGLTIEDPKIIGLSKSIETEGLLYPPILNQLDQNSYESIDGDRRLLAYFDILGNTEVQASIYRIDDENEIDYMRLAANWDREDFSTIEKGAYIWRILQTEMKKDNRVPIEEFWSQRSIRGEYLNRVSNLLAKPKSTIARHVTAWLRIPEKGRIQIARTRDELRAGKISPSKALRVDAIGRKVNQPKVTWEYFVPEGKPSTVTTKELNLIEGGIRKGQIKTFGQVKEFVEEKVEAWTEYHLTLKVDETKVAAQIASELDTEISRVYRGGVYLAERHLDELGKILTEM